MQNNISTIVEQKSTAISKVTNQIITTLYTKKSTKAKLLTTVEGLVIKYRLADDSDKSFSLVNDKVVVTRTSDVEERATLYADIYDLDGTTLLLTNKWELTLLNEKEAEELRSEEMNYMTNKLSQMIGYIGVVFMLLCVLITLNTVKPTLSSSFVYILLNIAMMLVGFLCCEKIKAYKKQYAVVMLVMAVINFALIFWLPIQLMSTYSKYVAIMNDPNAEITQILEYAKLLSALVRSTDGSMNMLPVDPYLRGGLMMGFSAAACACYGFASVTGYLKAVKLEKFLATRKNTK